MHFRNSRRNGLCKGNNLSNPASKPTHLHLKMLFIQTTVHKCVYENFDSKFIDITKTSSAFYIIYEQGKIESLDIVSNKASYRFTFFDS